MALDWERNDATRQRAIAAAVSIGSRHLSDSITPLFVFTCRPMMIRLLLLLSLRPFATTTAEPPQQPFTCFANNNKNAKGNFQDIANNLSRRELLLLGTGGVAYAKLVGDAISRIARGNAYPAAHEDRVQSTFQRAIVEGARAAQLREGGGSTSDGTSPLRRPLRVLEVGIGLEARVATRGLYGAALDELLLLSSGGGADKLPSSTLSGIDVLGVDLEVPKAEVLDQAREQLFHPSGCILPSFRATLDVMGGNIVEGLPQFSDGYFDCVVCALTLCSVDDQERAVNEIRRLVNPSGGTFGFVEHCAVRLNEEGEADKVFLNWQQRVLDPLQQVVADNCHLHRDTDLAIYDAFGVRNDQVSKILQKERFFVDDMWPVSCQCSGVVQRFI